ncbi:MAG: F0F1 ATP synthase subunit delta [Planctomycetes bacterium]|jgi:F-type H+-transporting ATPase subunit b|nr:F0F1 ATP synthase subunit delta [Planctomycetota bacterium]
MLIDWFTVIAQVVNFLILVWLMKRFLYGPILRAIDARESLIASRLAHAEARMTEARTEGEGFRLRVAEFDRQRAALLRDATEEAEAERRRLLGEARQAADVLIAKRQQALRDDARQLDRAIRKRTLEEVFAISRKTLSDLASASLEERLGEVFIRHLREMDGDAKDRLGAAIGTASDPAVVRSAFELPEGQRAAIRTALNETFSADVHVRFETAPDLISGIEFSVNGQKVSWSIADYLTSLERDVDELLAKGDEDAAAPGPEPEPEIP